VHCSTFLLEALGPFGCADKPAEKHCWLICCERKILFRLQKQAEKRRIISRKNRAAKTLFDMLHFQFLMPDADCVV
jgi:hypothetical protein